MGRLSTSARHTVHGSTGNSRIMLGSGCKAYPFPLSRLACRRERGLRGREGIPTDDRAAGAERLKEQKAFAKRSRSTLRGRSREQRRGGRSSHNASAAPRFFQNCTHCILARRLLRQVPYTLHEAAKISYGSQRRRRITVSLCRPPL